MKYFKTYSNFINESFSKPKSDAINETKDNLYLQLHKKYAEQIKGLRAKKIKKLTDLVSVQRWAMEDDLDMPAAARKQMSTIFNTERKLFKKYLAGDYSVSLTETEVNEANGVTRSDLAIKDLEKEGSEINWLDDANAATKKIWKKAGINPEDENTIILYSYVANSWPAVKKILKKNSINFKELEDPNSAGESMIVFVKESLNEAKKPKVGDKLTLLSNGKEGKVIKVMSDMANVDFGGGDIYGIMFSRIKGDKIEESYSDEQRMELADKGFALSDGSYPIKDLKDLKNAIMAYGRAKDQARTAKFIVKRAKALGAEDLIPDTEDFQKSLKEAKAYKSATRNELALYIINLQDEIKAYKQRGNKKYAEGSARDLEEVRAELASRKK